MERVGNDLMKIKSLEMFYYIQFDFSRVLYNLSLWINIRYFLKESEKSG